jgi:hypothetical protein
MWEWKKSLSRDRKDYQKQKICGWQEKCSCIDKRPFLSLEKQFSDENLKQEIFL